jgi:hypothetical protein
MVHELEVDDNPAWQGFLEQGRQFGPQCLEDLELDAQHGVQVIEQRQLFGARSLRQRSQQGRSLDFQFHPLGNQAFRGSWVSRGNTNLESCEYRSDLELIAIAGPPR